MVSSTVAAPFDSLTQSAIEFLVAAAKQLQSQPKFAVINLATGIELLLKARLVREHWALIVAKPEKASLAHFASGSFQSVNLDDAVSRLRNVVGLTLTKEEEHCFGRLRDHRNKFIHFVHPEFGTPVGTAALSTLAAEQCQAWFLLRRLLEERWSPHFGAYVKDIAKIHRLIAKNREFLSGKYQALRPEIEAASRAGAVYDVCGVCGFTSSLTSLREDPLMESQCAVCDRRNDFLAVTCPSCNAGIRVSDVGEAECSGCGYMTSLEWLIETFGPYEDPKEDPLTGYCTFCENTETRTVVPLVEMLLCLSCLEEHGRINTCQYCGESIAGDTEGSYTFGCLLCDGAISRDD